MFTGIVQEVGSVETVERGEGSVRLAVRARETAAHAKPGDSIAVSGVCLTATDVRDGVLSFDAVAETLARSSLGRLEPGAAVNVEPPLRAGDPLGGHLVQGHVDAVGTVTSFEAEGNGARLTVQAPPGILRYCAEKGSIAVEGASLTIAALDEGSFSVALVPHTLRATTLARLRPGDEVNLEVDVVAKYVERLLESRGE